MSPQIPIEQFIALQKSSQTNIALNKEIEADATLASHSEGPLVKIINEAGYPISSIWDLVNSSGEYPEIIPILTAHLSGPYHPKIKMAIARSLIEPSASTPQVSRALLDELYRVLPLRDDPWDGVKQSITYALSHLAHPTVYPEIKRLETVYKNSFLHKDLKKALKRCGKR
jgi:hypothetical protein